MNIWSSLSLLPPLPLLPLSFSNLYLCPVVSPRNTRCCWPALPSRTLWRNSSVCFISWSRLSSHLRLNSSETSETSKQRNRCEIHTRLSHLHTDIHTQCSCVVVTEQIFFFSGFTGSEAAGHPETHDVTKAQRGCWEELGTQTGDHHWGESKYFTFGVNSGLCWEIWTTQIRQQFDSVVFSQVELTDVQKKYYRAILERNFSFLSLGANSNSNVPNLLNTMMELRKCCNHPYLING